MANGLLCSETLSSSTPKYRHDSNSENTPPPLHCSNLKDYDLLCSEVLEDTDQLRKPVLAEHKQIYENFNHPPVKADCDNIILKDDRVLQNLLQNEERWVLGSFYQGLVFVKNNIFLFLTFLFYFSVTRLKYYN